MIGDAKQPDEVMFTDGRFTQGSSLNETAVCNINATFVDPVCLECIGKFCFVCLLFYNGFLDIQKIDCKFLKEKKL